MKVIYQSVLTILFALAVTSLAQAATVTGTITYEGELPKLKPIKMDADPICLSHHAAEVMPQVLLIGEGNTLGNVFVHVTKGAAKKDYPVPAEEIVIDQKGCEYHPHVVGVRVGQTVKILNPDGTLHNVHAIPKANKEFNLAMPKFRTEITITFDKPEFMFPIKCDVHPWMGAWISVMDHPYFSVTGTEGKFSLADLPPGEYEIEAWHEKLGTQTATVSIASAEEAKTVDFKFARPAQ